MFGCFDHHYVDNFSNKNNKSTFAMTLDGFGRNEILLRFCLLLRNSFFFVIEEKLHDTYYYQA